ncbi:sphingomyelin phosphodiesterase [Agromyces sp. NPDC058136]|uniref:sphingomyelin phosphodiesterase n=1 Tax=Agromyces sp. NPDC058136 TaxID=3346354 RepID=UPI0036DF2747
MPRIIRSIGLTATVAVAALAVTSLAVAPAQASEPVPESIFESADAPALSVLTHNVMMLPPITGSFDNGTRARLIAESDYVRGHDVVVFEEAFDNGPSDRLKSGLAAQYPYQTPVMGRSKSGWDQTLGDYSWATPEDGGVTVLSKWPITRKVQYVYDDACGADWFSNKGFVYVRLDVDGSPVHVVGTHGQAEDTGCVDAESVRASQFGELDAFLDGLAIPSTEPVVVTGDLNVIRESPEYAQMLATLDVVEPAYAGPRYTFDPATNSMTSTRYPGHAPEHLDYVLYRTGNQGAPWTNTTITPVAPPSSFGGVTHNDYADHYPVVAR